jgi:rhamnose utilization protein RhaD (predicted bifunctional aldolase and dehydrogenase)
MPNPYSMSKTERALYTEYRRKFSPNRKTPDYAKNTTAFDPAPNLLTVAGIRRIGSTKRAAIIMAAALASMDEDPANADHVSRYYKTQAQTT